MTWQNGDCLQNGKYLILEELGEGGFGITYKAKHTHLNQIVVIKTPNDSLKNDPNYPRFVERFIEEGRKLASLSEKKHPHIVRATDLFFEGTLPCLAMDFVEGKNLFKIVERNPLSEAKALEYIRQIGSALCVVHGVGMVHRDAHPANIMVKPDGNAVLIDFGLAADVAAAIPSSQHPANRAFAPYEQMQGNGLPTVDVYTLAATLYFIVTRRPPTTAIDRKLNNMALPEPKSFNSNISKELNSAILKGMQLEARNRPQSMRAWLDLLPNSKGTISAQPKLPVALIILILAIGGGGFYLWQNLKPSTSLTTVASPSSLISEKDKQAEADALILGSGEKIINQDYKGAIADYTKAIQLKPNYAEAYYNRGLAKTDLEDRQGAMADLSEAIRLKSGYAGAYLMRGSIKSELGDKQAAIFDYNEVIRLRSDDALAYYARAVVKAELGDKQAAILDYNEAIKKKNNRNLDKQSIAQIYFNRGLAKYSLGDIQESINDFNEAIKSNSNYAQAYYNRGKAKTNLGDKQGAINDYTEAIRLKSDYVDAYKNRGAVRFLLEDSQGAISDSNEVIRLKPELAEGYVVRGIAKSQLGDKEGSRIDLKKAAELFKQQGDTENYNLTVKLFEQS